MYAHALRLKYYFSEPDIAFADILIRVTIRKRKELPTIACDYETQISG